MKDIKLLSPSRPHKVGQEVIHPHMWLNLIKKGVVSWSFFDKSVVGKKDNLSSCALSKAKKEQMKYNYPQSMQINGNKLTQMQITVRHQMVSLNF